jgi:hypothetical protein
MCSIQCSPRGNQTLLACPDRDGLEMRIGFLEAVLLAVSMGYSLTLWGKAALEESMTEEEVVL